MGPTTFPFFPSFHTTFTPLSRSLLYIKNQRVPPLHPLFFLFSTSTLYIFLNLRVQTQCKKLGGTEGVIGNINKFYKLVKKPRVADGL